MLECLSVERLRARAGSGRTDAAGGRDDPLRPQRVADLLRFYEERPAGSTGGRPVAYDFRWIREELGIEDRRE